MGLTEEQNTIRATETSFAILECLQRLDGGRVSTVAAELDLAKSTVHSHLTTMRLLGYLVQEGDFYYPSLRFLELGRYVQNRKQVYELAGPTIETLAKETGELVQFAIVEHSRAVYVHRHAGAQAVSTDADRRQRVHLHSTAAGKALLAFMSREEVESVIDEAGLPARTASTITDRDSLFAELEQIRRDGFAVNDSERIDGLRAVGVPVFDHDKNVLGSISVAGPSHRMNGEYFSEELPSLLMGVASELTMNITYA